MNQVQRYTQDELRSLNRREILPVDPKLLEFFSKFPKTKYTNNDYQNPYNLNFIFHRKKLFPTHEPFSDQKIIADFKSILLKLTRDNLDETSKHILNINFPQTIKPKIATVLHKTIINCIFLVDVYAELILLISRQDNEITNYLNEIIIQQLYHPKKFSDENDEIACETAEQKEKKWRISNGLLIAELFLNNVYSPQFMVNDIIVPIVNHIKVEDTINIEVLKKIFPIILPKLVESKTNISSIFYKLKKISENKEYPPRLRYLLMDIIELNKK